MRISFNKIWGNLPVSARVLFAPVVLVAMVAVAQSGISIESRVDKSAIKIGDLITYTVELSHARGLQVEMPELAENLGDFEIRDYRVHDAVERDGAISQRIEYVISTFEVGDFVIPSLTFYYLAPGDSLKHELKTQKISIVVESLQPSEAGSVRDIKPPEGFPDDYRRFIIWASVALAGLVLLVVSLYIWRRRRAGKGVLPQKVDPPRPAHESALQELRKLRESPLLAQGEVKEFHVQASDIIRRYCEGRYFIVALEMTSIELLEDLQHAEVDPENIHLVQEFLEVCDLVKFAKLKPTPAESLALLDKAVRIVEKTKLIYDITLEEESQAEPGNNSADPGKYGPSENAVDKTAKVKES